MFGPLTTLIPVALIAFGLLFFGIGVNTLRGGRRRGREWEQVPGRVIGSRLDSMGSGDGQLRCQVAFGYQGREVVFWNRYTSTLALTRSDVRWRCW